MRNIVLQILAAMSCVLFVSCTNFMPPADFTSEGMEGKWYITGFGSNAKWLKSKKASLKTYTVMMEIRDTGDMHFSTSYLKKDGTCWRMSYLAQITETPGRFTYHSQKYDNYNDVRFADVVHNNYAIVHTIITKNRRANILNTLYSRTTQVSADLQEKFKQFSQSNGVLTGNTVILPPNGECPEA